jgi:hypothetical protein
MYGQEKIFSKKQLDAIKQALALLTKVKEDFKEEYDHYIEEGSEFEALRDLYVAVHRLKYICCKSFDEF